MKDDLELYGPDGCEKVNHSYGTFAPTMSFDEWLAHPARSRTCRNGARQPDMLGVSRMARAARLAETIAETLKPIADTAPKMTVTMSAHLAQFILKSCREISTRLAVQFTDEGLDTAFNDVPVTK